MLAGQHFFDLAQITPVTFAPVLQSLEVFTEFFCANIIGDLPLLMNAKELASIFNQFVVPLDDLSQLCRITL